MAKDPYRYFRIEAQELLEGLSQGLLALEKGSDKELMKRLLRQAHTFKGASRVVRRSDIGDLAHEMEDLLAPLRDREGPVQRETIDQSLVLLDRIRALVASLSPKAREESLGHKAQGDSTSAADAETDDSQATPTEEEPTIRIAVADLDAILESALEAHSAATSLTRHTGELEAISARARVLLALVAPGRQQPDIASVRIEVEGLVRDLGRAQQTSLEGIDRIMVELVELRAASSDLRLVPAQNLIGDLERVTRDAARTLDKDVEMRASGTDTHIDAHVLAGLRKALVHLVRNSVAHGIEDRATRARLGKPATGCIDIKIERRGHRVSISCRDDGSGLDLEAVRAVAVERRLVDQELASAMDEAALGRLLLLGGVSTSRTVGGVSGRGVGLEAAGHTIERLKGEISLRSTPARGTVVELLVPLSLSAMPTLSVHVGSDALLLPLDSVRRTLRVSSSDISHDADGQHIAFEGGIIPFLPLARALGRPSQEMALMQSAVMIEAEGRRAAIGVDQLGAVSNIVVRSIPKHAAADPIVSGAAFNDDGTPRLVLAPPALIRAASSGHFVGAAATIRELPPLLIIDDSLTTRMLEQSILESAGYEVDLATSAEDGLKKARKRKYGVFVVDVEMPGMSGFEFIAAIRSDAELRDTPAILVTSRGEPDDERRGEEVGAQAYIVKSKFDQAVLLETIKRLIA